MNQTITVIDLGDTKATALIASGTADGGIEVHHLVSVDSFGLKKGAIVDVVAATKTLRTLLGHLAKDSNQDEFGEIVFTISGTHLSGGTVQGIKLIIPGNRAVTHQDVMEVVNHSRSAVVPPDRTQLQAIPREFRIDGVGGIANPVGKLGSKLEVITYLVSGHNTQVSQLAEVLESNSTSMGQFVYAPLASGLGVLTGNEIEHGAVVVDIGGQKTDVGVFTNGAFAFGCCIPAGGQNVSNDLVQLLQVSIEEADRLKIQHGVALAKEVTDREAIEVRQLGQPTSRPMQRKVLCEIIESRMRELSKLIHAQIDKSGHLASIKSSIVLTGGGAKIPRCVELFSEQFPDHKVRIAEPNLGDKQLHVGIAAVIGAAHFVLQSNTEFRTVDQSSGWQDRVKGLWSMLNGKSQ